MQAVNGVTIKVIPQSNDQVAASNEIKLQQDDEETVRAISLEAWRKESDGKWRMVRWYGEKGKVRDLFFSQT